MAAARLCQSVRRLSTAAAASSSSSSSQLPAPIASAYREALAFLSADREQKLAYLSSPSGLALSEGEREKLEVQAWINDPFVRAQARSGKGDLGKAVYRHLAKEEWRKERLPVLGQRLEQMKVLEDLRVMEMEGGFRPEVDLRVWLAEEGKEEVRPGEWVLPSQTRSPLRVTAQTYHPLPSRLYTLLLLSPDVPNPSTQGYSTYLHYLLPNIQLDATSSAIIPAAADTKGQGQGVQQQWVPPHPARVHGAGDKGQRYIYLLLTHSSPLSSSSSSGAEGATRRREEFDLKEWIKENKARPVGATFWREKWDGTVSDIYAEELGGKPEPVFGPPTRRLKYAGVEYEAKEKPARYLA